MAKVTPRRTISFRASTFFTVKDAARDAGIPMTALVDKVMRDYLARHGYEFAGDYEANSVSKRQKLDKRRDSEDLAQIQPSERTGVLVL